MVSEEDKIKYRKSIAEFRLIDDTFMAVVFGGELQLSEMLLHTTIVNDRIRVIKSIGQYAIKNKYAKDIKNTVLANRVRHFKEEESGVEEMCEIMQKLADDAAYKNSVKIAEKLLNKGNSIDDVVDVTELPREKVEAIAKRLGKLIA